MLIARAWRPALDYKSCRNIEYLKGVYLNCISILEIRSTCSFGIDENSAVIDLDMSHTSTSRWEIYIEVLKDAGRKNKSSTNRSESRSISSNN
jgi:hypothetical protein